MLQLLHMTDYQTLKYGMSMYQSVMMYFRSSRQNAFCKKVFLEISQNKHENTCARVSFLIKFQALGLHRYQKETLAQVFSCEFCETSKKTFSYRAPPMAISGVSEPDSKCKSITIFAVTWSRYFYRCYESYQGVIILNSLQLHDLT